MIPRITGIKNSSELTLSYLKALRDAGFSGDLDSSHPSRLLCATDNSVYQCMPEAVIFPKSAGDIATALRVRAQPEFLKIVISPRGGGTGTNGQSLNTGVMIDCSRYMKQVIAYDPAAREITVQPSCIKDELNELIKKDGLFFSPELSTSSRATIGGMISDDAAGQGSLKYGRTSSHVKSVTVVLSDGSVAVFGPKSGEALEKCLKADSLEGQIYRRLVPLLKENREKVVEIFPKLNRFMTGYDLYHAWDPETGTVNLARLICGAEGTLGVICEAVLDLTALPKYRALLVVKYADFISALRSAPLLIKGGALSVETVDSKVLGLARQDAVWIGVRDYIREVPGHEISGINIVEFSGQDEAEEKRKLETLFAALQERAHRQEGGILGVQQVLSAAGIAAVYGMRKKSVGLLANAAGRRKLVAFTEDTVVPPEHLADYITEFRALLDSKKVPYGMFGHVDTGLMHVRPALDLTTDEDRQNLVEISKGVVALCEKYGGQMWGEHGRGYRSVFGERFFKELYPVAREVKEIFDPQNVLNPGKICVPLHDKEDKLVAIDGLMRGDLDRTIPLSVRDAFRGALSCNGNGQCFSYSHSALMCPSYRYTKDHVRSPKGYAELMREWLKILNDKGFNPQAEELSALTALPNPWRFLRRAFNTLSRGGDYNSEILEQIKTCLACKSCKGICPTHVNSADLNSRFISMYYGRYLRPLSDLLVLNAERLIPLAAKFPALSNFLFKNRLCAALTRGIFGLADLPLVSEQSLKAQCRKAGIKCLSVAGALKERPELLIVADPFTASYEADGLVRFARAAEGLGCKAALLRPYVNGKLMVIRGDRRRFVHYAAKQAARLQALAATGITLAGYDPALTLCYRDEYEELLGKARGDFAVLLPEEWLIKALASPKGKAAAAALAQKARALGQGFADPRYLFCHCSERALLPQSVLQWQQAFGAFGLSLIPVPVACCGMAGLHGHLVQNLDESRRVWEQNWKCELEKRPYENCLATGYSCRSQSLRMEGKALKHPLDVICALMDAKSADAQGAQK